MSVSGESCTCLEPQRDPHGNVAHDGDDVESGAHAEPHCLDGCRQGVDDRARRGRSGSAAYIRS